ncbi:hypothetical protein G7Y89_g5849 [Cudoniella acicularis]|uniref:Laccase n=1 Tax=Cudoniella acicularis TaxID=354080 RepID=A0A8H4RNY4_9HELO|nr:hypothetical protein G7Y89_g5849 [Cudoniella acicularis]
MCVATFATWVRAHKVRHFQVFKGNPKEWNQQFAVVKPSSDDCPWGENTVENFDPRDDAPSTGVVRRYHFTIARGKASPDGYEKDVILVNNQFPGPLIEANWGDTISVTVFNNITAPEEGTSLHWHGFSQKDTPWYDGVVGITQCPIPPGTSLVYEFKADTYGSTWYHAHYASQYSDGLSGPLIVYGPRHVEYDYDLGPVMVGDYYHQNYTVVAAEASASTNDFTVYVPASDNNLINGKNSFNCSLVTDGHKCTPNAPLPKFHLKKGKTHLLRLINSGAAAMQRFSIDGHKLTIIANDFTPINPYTVDVVNLGVGQRTDVLVTGLDNPQPSYWMRSTLAMNCTRTLNPYAKAIVQYNDAPNIMSPNSTAYFLPELNCGNDALNLTTPIFPIEAELEPDITQVIELDLFTNSTGSHIWIMNNQTFRADYSNPLLFAEQAENFTSPPEAEQMIFDFGKAKTVRIVLNNKYQAAHPMHLHGVNFQVLSEGQGYWDGKAIINPSNPQRRDTQMLRRYGHMVIQVESLNPGVWPFHCHIAWHASTGLYMNFVMQKEDIQDLEVPASVTDSCKAWDVWEKTNRVGQTDSGLRI